MEFYIMILGVNNEINRHGGWPEQLPRTTGETRKGHLTMEITIGLDELITESDKATLARVLDCQVGNGLEEALTKIGRAAVSEYVEMLLGKSLPTRAREMHERRLYHLLKQYFVGRLPTEAEIARMLQLTETQSRTLLRHTKTKFKFELEHALNATIKLTLSAAERRGSGYRVVIQSDAILEELRNVVSTKGPRLDQVAKVKNSACLYDIPEDTFNLLLNHYGVGLSNIEAAVVAGE